ncbi:phage integrase family protein [Sinorhizobium americanum]|uniref:Phage integrase family protein n=1 Tax=Sinorhizobium americanum TaxID=194963 RepID=A0A4R2BZD6_9HYPH|nr:phage integrase family protein [Sinorhizobium americanum]
MKLKYVFQRNNTYYFRITVPQSARATFGKVIWKSMETTDLEEAQIKSGEMIKAYRQRFANANNEPAVVTPANVKEESTNRGIDYRTAEEVSLARIPDSIEMLSTIISELKGRKKVDEAEVVVFGGAINPSLSLDDLLTKYKKYSAGKWADLDDRARQKKWNRYAEPIADFKKTMGDMDVLTIRSKDAFDYAAELGERVNNKTLKSETAKKKLLFLNAMVRKVFQAEYPDRNNPFENAVIDHSGDGETRKPFTEDEIQAVNKKLAESDANDELRAILHIAENTGAHAKEICLLSPDDFFVDDEEEYPFIRIGVNANRKRLKTGGARHRDLPLIGKALDAAKRYAKTGFPRYCRSGGSEALSAAANKLIQTVAEDKTTYSYRHRMADILRNSKCDSDLLKAIMGHNGGITADYGDGFELSIKAEAIQTALAKAEQKSKTRLSNTN